MKNRKIKPPNLLDFLTLVLKKRKRKGKSANSLNHIKLMPGFLNTVSSAP